MKKFIFILFLVLLASLISVSALDLNLTILRADNATTSVHNWTCTVYNDTQSYTAVALDGFLDLEVNNSDNYLMNCYQTLGSTTTEYRYFNLSTAMNVTTHVVGNITFPMFNISETHTATSYTKNEDITYLLNVTNLDNVVINDTTVKAYVSTSAVNTGCSSQSELYDFNLNQTQSTSVSLDLTVCGLNTHYLDMGVFDPADSSAIAVITYNDGKSSPLTAWTYRRETLSLSTSTNSVLPADTLEGLPEFGTDLGGFLSNLAPGVGKFIITLGIFGGILGIIGAIVFVIVVMVKGATKFGEKK